MNEIIYNQSLDTITMVQKTIGQLDKRTLAEWGDKALEMISDYPLYASSSNISYEEAIIIAMIIFEDFMQKEES